MSVVKEVNTLQGEFQKANKKIKTNLSFSKVQMVISLDNHKLYWLLCEDILYYRCFII